MCAGPEVSGRARAADGPAVRDRTNFRWSRLDAGHACRELPKVKRCWLLRLLTVLRTATTLGLCGLTFELTPTVEASAVSPDGDDVTLVLAGLTALAVAGRGVERGVRPHSTPAEQ